MMKGRRSQLSAGRRQGLQCGYLTTVHKVDSHKTGYLHSSYTTTVVPETSVTSTCARILV